jgi:flagellar hook-associated protein 2
MSDPIGSFSGIASGIQWRDMITSIMEMETQRRLDPLTTARSLEQKRYEAWGTWQSLVTKFRDASKSLRDATAFAQFKVTGGTSAASGRALFTASASTSASPGSYDVEVLDLARANKLSGAVQASANSALGITGEFAVNGGRVTIAATDTLSTVRDKINALNSGSTPSGVTASVLSTGASEYRLVLTADQTGASGIELVDDAAGTLQTLGLVDVNKTLNLGASGGAQTYKVSSSTAAIAAMLGVTMPPPSTITVGGRTINVDLSVDSLSSIAAKIMAAGGSASVVTETVNGKAGYRLVTSDTVTASTPDGVRTLEVLGFLENGRSGVAQVVASENLFSVAGGAAATASTLLTDLHVNGNPLGIAVGDTFTLQGARGDGTAVNVSFTVGASDTVQTMLDKLNDATAGYGAGARTASATFVNGQLLLSDATAGDSQLSLAMSVAQPGGGTVNLGRMNTQTVGRLREVVAGSDASVRLDGVLVRRPTNTISDALTGVTLNLQQAEVGTTSTLTVDRDADAIVKTMNALATAYNDLVKFRAEQSKPGQPLYNSSTLRSSLASLTNSLLSNVSGTTGSYTTSAVAGLSLQKDGTLALEETTFRAALASNLGALTTLFATTGTATSSEVSYFLASERTVPGTYAVDITSLATKAQALGSGFSGTYVDDATPDTLTFTDAWTGTSGSIQLDNGDTIDTIVNKLNAMFAQNKLSLSATKNGNDLVVNGSQYGSAANFTVSYTAGGADGSAQLGLAAQSYAGLDVVGTIGGLPAKGVGQLLTGDFGGATEGLAIRYTGTTTGAQGTVTYVKGVSGALYEAADLIARSGGTVTTQQDSLQRRITDLQSRADTVQQALDRKRQMLTVQFVEMERALGRIQQQATALSGLISMLGSQDSSS